METTGVLEFCENRGSFAKVGGGIGVFLRKWGSFGEKGVVFGGFFAKREVGRGWIRKIFGDRVVGMNDVGGIGPSPRNSPTPSCGQRTWRVCWRPYRPLSLGGWQHRPKGLCFALATFQAAERGTGRGFGWTDFKKEALLLHDPYRNTRRGISNVRLDALRPGGIFWLTPIGLDGGAEGISNC
jgi:hypothetical protein